MEHLDFILWTCLFPVCCAAGNWLRAKERAVNKKQPLSDAVEGYVSLFSFIIWAVIAIQLY